MHVNRLVATPTGFPFGNLHGHFSPAKDGVERGRFVFGVLYRNNYSTLYKIPFPYKCPYRTG